MGAAFLCVNAGIENTIQNSAAVYSLEQLQNDKALIVQAAAHAQKAADFILGTKFEDAVAG
jgi:antirestriction protein ArdC